MGKKWLIGQGATAVDTVLYCDGQVQLDGFTHAVSECVTSGGSAANLLVTAAALGIPSALVAKIGDDSFGRQFRRELLEDGVSDRYLMECPGGVTLHTYIAVAPDGGRSIIVHGGDCYHTLSGEDIPEDILDEAFLLYTDGSPKPGAAALARLAGERNIPVFYQRECPESGQDLQCRELGEALLECADLISGGPEIFRQLVGSDLPETALEKTYDRWKPESGVIMTAGSRGAYWYDGRTLLHQPVFPVRSVDSTGAGDAFCGGLIFAHYVRHWSKPESLRFAAACGAMKCMVRGPRLRAAEAEVLQLIEQYPEEAL